MPGPKFREETYKQFVEKLKNKFSINAMFQGETDEEKAARNCLMEYTDAGIWFHPDTDATERVKRENERRKRLEANPFEIKMSDLEKMLDSIEIDDPQHDKFREEICDRINDLETGIDGFCCFVDGSIDKSNRKEAAWNVTLDKIRSGGRIIDDLYQLDEMTGFKFSNTPEMQALKTVFRGVKSMSDEILEQTLQEQMEEVDEYINSGDNIARQADQDLRDNIRGNMAKNIDVSKLDEEMKRNARICDSQQQILITGRDIVSKLNQLEESATQRTGRESQDKIAEAEYIIALLEVRLAEDDLGYAGSRLQTLEKNLAAIPDYVNGLQPHEYMLGVTNEDVEKGRDLYGEFRKAIEHQEIAEKLKGMDILKPGFVLNEESAKKAVEEFAEICPDELPGWDEGVVYSKDMRDQALDEYGERSPEIIKEIIEKQLENYVNELTELKEKYPTRYEMATLLPEGMQKVIDKQKETIKELKEKKKAAEETANEKSEEVRSRGEKTGHYLDVSAIRKKADEVNKYEIVAEIKRQQQIINDRTEELKTIPESPETQFYRKITQQVTEYRNETKGLLDEAKTAGDKYKNVIEGYRSVKERYDNAAVARRSAEKALRYLGDNSTFPGKYIGDADKFIERLGKNKNFFHKNSDEYSAMRTTLKTFSDRPTDANLEAVAAAAQHYLAEKAKGSHPFASSMRSYRLGLARDILEFANANKARVDLASNRRDRIGENSVKLGDTFPLSKNGQAVAEELVKVGIRNGSFKEENELGKVNDTVSEKAQELSQKRKEIKEEVAKACSNEKSVQKKDVYNVKLMGEIL